MKITRNSYCSCKKLNNSRYKPGLIYWLMIDWFINWLKVWIIDMLIIRNGPKTPGWCRSQFLIPRHLTFAQDVRKQLVGICHNAGQSTFQLLTVIIYFLENSSFCFIFFTKNYPPLTFKNRAFYTLRAPLSCINSRF